jgi:Mce-associated membrane protein
VHASGTAGRTGLLVLAAVSLALALAGTGLVAAAAQVRHGPSAANQALTDQPATRQVLATVSTGVSAIYSYSYADLGVTRRAAQRVLAGQAAAQYQELFVLLQRNVAAQQLTVKSRVVQDGVSWLSRGTAQVLVFIDQTSTRGNHQAASARAQLAITAQWRGGRWLITGIQAR